MLNGALVGLDSLFDVAKLVSQRGDQLAPSDGEFVIGVLQYLRQRATKPGDRLRQHDAVLGEQPADLVTQPCALADQALPNSMDGQQVLLLERLRGHKPHGRPLSGLAILQRVLDAARLILVKARWRHGS